MKKWEHLITIIQPGGRITNHYGSMVSATLVSPKVACVYLGVGLGEHTALSARKEWTRYATRLLE